MTRIATRGLFSVKKKAIPKVTYTEPELAQVGLSQEEAEVKYGLDNIHRLEVPYSQNDRARTDNVSDGLMAVIAERLSGRVLGVHIVGPQAGELLAVFTLAMDNKLSLWKLRRTIFAYPTYSLIIKKAGDHFFSAQVKTLKQDFINFGKRHVPKAIAGVFWLTLIYLFYHYKATNQLSNKDVLYNFYDFFTMSLYGPLIYMVLYAVRPVIFFPATLLTALSGALFGFWWGIIYTIIGENTSANFAYWIGRFFGKDLKLDDTIIGNWVEKLRQNTFESVLLMRLFYVPFDLTNYGAGIIKANWKAYTLATFIGIMPGLTTFVALGAAVNIEAFRDVGLTFDIFNPKFLVLSLTIFILSLIISRLLKRTQRKKR